VAQQTQTQQLSTRLKGKERKLAREAAAAETSTTGTSLINVGEFVPMAETVARQRPKAEVPDALSRLFDRAIKARQKAAEWFKVSHENTIVDESNRTHSHFVKILKRAAAIFRPLVKEARPQNSKTRETQ
jgi:hypothetical protein